MPMRPLLFLLLPLSLFAQTDKSAQFLETVPDSLLKQATSVVQLREESFELLDDGTGIYKTRLIITFLSEEGVIPYFSEQYDKFHKLMKLEVRMFDKAGKKVRELMMPLDAVQQSKFLNEPHQ